MYYCIYWPHFVSLPPPPPPPPQVYFCVAVLHHLQPQILRHTQEQSLLTWLLVSVKLKQEKIKRLFITPFSCPFFEIFSDLNQVVPDHLVDESQTRKPDSPPDYPQRIVSKRLFGFRGLPWITFLYSFFFGSLLRLTSFLSQNKIKNVPVHWARLCRTFTDCTRLLEGKSRQRKDIPAVNFKDRKTQSQTSVVHIFLTFSCPSPNGQRKFETVCFSIPNTFPVAQKSFQSIKKKRLKNLFSFPLLCHFLAFPIPSPSFPVPFAFPFLSTFHLKHTFGRKYFYVTR